MKFDAVPAADWTGTADRVICVGAAHAFGGTVQALRRLHDVLRGGGRLLFGDAIWQRSPGPEALALFGESVRPLPDLAPGADDVRAELDPPTAGLPAGVPGRARVRLPGAGPLKVCAHGGYLIAAALVAFWSAGTDRVPTHRRG